MTKSNIDKLRDELGLYCGPTDPKHQNARDLLDKIVEEEIAKRYSWLMIKMESAERDKDRLWDLQQSYDKLIESNAELKIKYLELLERVNRL